MKDEDNSMFLLSESDWEFLTRANGQAEDSKKSSEALRSELDILRKKLADIEFKQRKIERKYHESENRFWSFFHGNDAVKLLIDPNSGDLVDFNQLACAFYGYSQEELKKKTILDLTPLPEQVLLKELHKAGLQWTRAAFFTQRLASGAVIDVDVNAGPVYNLGHKLLLCIISDSSPAQRAIETIKLHFQKSIDPNRTKTNLIGAELKEYETLLDCIHTHICYFSDPYTYGMANKAHADFLGVEKENLYSARISDILDPAGAEETIEENKKVFAEKKPLKTTKWVKDAQKESRLLYMEKAPVLNAENEVTSVVCTAYDITKTRMNQEALKGKLKILKSEAMIDSLTNIPNRRYFDQALEREWGRAKRNQSVLSLIMLDIDFFKPFNDNYGHLAGDKCLAKVAEVLSKALTRPGDIIFRFGGEEFAAILPQTDAKGAQKIAKKMLTLVQELKIKHEYSPVADVLTLSAGFTTITPLVGLKDFPKEVLIKKADQALYEAKQTGRNRIVSKMLKFNGTESYWENPAQE